jgi:pilus assembly protein CpaB
MVVVAVAIGLLAVFLAAMWMKQQPSLAATKVVVAARDLEVGTRLRADLLQVVDWPAASPVKGAISDPKKLVEPEERVINTQIQKGEPVTEAKLAPPGSKGGLSAVLSEGRRAITVKVNEIVGVAGFALPGNHVDVLVNTQDEQNKPVSKIVLERILVLAVAQETSQAETKARVVNAVTLEVTPEQAETLDLARSVGSLSLVLRSQVDKTPAMTAGARKSDLLKLATAPIAPPQAEQKTAPAAKPVARPARKVAAKAAPKPEPPKVEVIRGVKKTLE